MRQNERPSESIVIDSFNFEGGVISQFLDPAPATVFIAPRQASDTAVLERTIAEFVKQQHPRLLVYSPNGQLGRIWLLNDDEKVDVDRSGLKLQLHRLWQESEYRIYEIEYRAPHETSAVLPGRAVSAGIKSGKGA
jgi:hypothetical protein